MCSNRCANPVRPGNSFAGPTWYHKFTATIGSRRSSEKITSSPFSSLYFANFNCGTTRAAGFAATLTGACGGALAGVFRGTAGGVCADGETANANNANKLNDSAFLERSLIAVSSPYVANKKMISQRTAGADVPQRPGC